MNKQKWSNAFGVFLMISFGLCIVCGGKEYHAMTFIGTFFHKNAVWITAVLLLGLAAFTVRQTVYSKPASSNAKGIALLLGALFIVQMFVRMYKGQYWWTVDTVAKDGTFVLLYALFAYYETKEQAAKKKSQ